MILGDPLCQPWASRPSFESDFEANRELAASIPLTTTSKQTIDRFLVLVDGIQQSSSIPGVRDYLRINGLADGAHELTLVAIAEEQPQTHSQKTFPFQIKRYGKSIELRVETSAEEKCCSLGESVKLTAKCADAEKIKIFHHLEDLGTIEGSEGELTIPAEKIGLGETELYAVGQGDGWLIQSKPLAVQIAPPPPFVNQSVLLGGFP